MMDCEFSGTLESGLLLSMLISATNLRTKRTIRNLQRGLLLRIRRTVNALLSGNTSPNLTFAMRRGICRIAGSAAPSRRVPRGGPIEEETHFPRGDRRYSFPTRRCLEVRPRKGQIVSHFLLELRGCSAGSGSDAALGQLPPQKRIKREQPSIRCGKQCSEPRASRWAQWACGTKRMRDLS
jgi:hypothetical protein